MSSAIPPNQDRPNVAEPELHEGEGPLPKENPTSGEAPLGYIALKYTFFTPKRGDLCGAFCLIFEGTTGETLFQTLWATRSDSLANLKTSQDWRTFNKLISHIGPYDKVWGDKLFSLLSELLPAADRMEIYQAETQQQKSVHVLSRIEGTIRKGYERVTHYFLDVSCDVEVVPREELIEAGILEAPPDAEAPSGQENPEGEGKSFSGLLVPCLPVIDPTRGKAASELVPGDILEVQIQNSVGAGGLVQQFLQAIRQSPVFPVDTVEKHDDKIYIYLTINEEMRGLLTLTKDLRLRTLNTTTENPGRTGVTDNLIFFFLLSLALWGFFLALRSLF